MTEPCAYCGTLAENPRRLRWVLGGTGARTISIHLCLACSQSWCSEPSDRTRSADSSEDRPSAHRRPDGGRTAA